MSLTRSSPEIKKGRKPSARLTRTQLTARRESPRIFKRFFLTSEGLDIQRCGAGTSARALETNTYALTGAQGDELAGGISTPWHVSGNYISFINEFKKKIK